MSEKRTGWKRQDERLFVLTLKDKGSFSESEATESNRQGFSFVTLIKLCFGVVSMLYIFNNFFCACRIDAHYLDIIIFVQC